MSIFVSRSSRNVVSRHLIGTNAMETVDIHRRRMIAWVGQCPRKIVDVITKGIS